MGRIPIILMLWMAIAFTILVWSVVRLGGARSQLDSVIEGARQTQEDLGRIARLRSVAEGVSRGRRPDADLVARAQRALTTAGLPISAFVGVQPRSDIARPNSPMHVQTVQLKLQNLRPTECGAWLAAWRQDNQPWFLQELQLVHAAGSPTKEKDKGKDKDKDKGENTSLDADRYDVTVLLAAPYVEDAS